MAGWEEELAVLLQELGVKQEEPRRKSQQPPLSKPPKSTRQPNSSSSPDSPASPSSPGSSHTPMRSDIKRHWQYADALFRNSGETGVGAEGADEDDEDDALWMNDLSLMRHEVDSIVSQVVRLMQRGDLEPSLKEDVMIVLRALRRRASVTQQAAASEEAYLEFASAMLHFCRLVLELSEVASSEE